MGKLRNYFLNHYPRTDFHELNQDWMISMLFDMINQVENFVEMNSVKYADPIQWDITRQYEKNTIVVDPITCTAYLSNHPVPMGVALSRTEYWSVIFDLGRFITLASQNFANSYEAVLTTTATMPTDEGRWVVWNSILYRAKNDIHVGDMYVIDGNIEKYTVEMFFDELAHLIAEETEARIEADNVLHGEIVDESVARENADTTLQDNIDAEALAREEADEAEATAREDADTALGGRIDDEITARENADTALGGRIDDEITARENADTSLSDSILAKIGDLDNLPTTVKTSIVASINELYTDIHAIPITTSYTTPENHGAVGDGVTDDTVAINAAFQSENIVVFKNNATYLITDSITLPDNSKLIGNGATLKLKSGSVISYEEVTNDRVGMLTIKNVDNVCVENLTIDVNAEGMPLYTNFNYVDNVAIAIESASNITIKGCKMINLYTEGIDSRLTSGSVNIIGNYFKHTLQYQGLRKDCIYLVSHANGALTVNNNIVNEEEIDNQYGCGGIFFANVRNAECKGNIVLNCGRRNVHGHPVASICVYSECLNIDVSHNYIKSIEGIFRADASAKISFRYNYCSFSGAGGYSDSDYLRFTYYDPSYLGYWGEYTIEGNSIMIDDNNRGGARGIGVGHNLSRPFHSIRIINNDFSMFNDAIAIYAKIDDIHIKGNRFKGTSSGSHPDIRISYGGDDIFIEGNKGGTIRCERDAGSSDVYYHLNIANNSCGTGGAAIKIDHVSYGTVHDNNMNGRFEAGSGIYSVIVHDNNSHDSGTGYGYYGTVTGQHDNYYGNSLVSSFQ